MNKQEKQLLIGGGIVLFVAAIVVVIFYSQAMVATSITSGQYKMSGQKYTASGEVFLGTLTGIKNNCDDYALHSNMKYLVAKQQVYDYQPTGEVKKQCWCRDSNYEVDENGMIKRTGCDKGYFYDNIGETVPNDFAYCENYAPAGNEGNYECYSCNVVKRVSKGYASLYVDLKNPSETTLMGAKKVNALMCHSWEANKVVRFSLSTNFPLKEANKVMNEISAVMEG